MTRISAIEIENFQSIERRTRIEFKPLTLLFGPNSAGKSSIFDALELLTVLLDPTKFDSDLATNMIDRWSRRNGHSKVRTTELAIEFPFHFEDIYDIWGDSNNWPENLIRSHDSSYYLNYENTVEPEGLEGATVRIELQIEVIDTENAIKAFLSECSLSVKDKFLFKVTKKHPTNPEAREFRQINDDDFYCYRYLTLYEAVKYDFESNKEFDVIKVVMGLRPLAITKAPISDFGEDKKNNYQIATDALFYFGSILFKSHRKNPGVVVSDRRAPKPNEALAVVDLGLGGWWSRNSFSPSSPAVILKSTSKELDEHYQGLAEAAHAELLLRAAHHVFWGDSHAAKYIEEVRSKARTLEIVNNHLEKSLFTEKLYKLSCAATLMVPIDLEEEDPWSYYALAQPAAVRLFLEDGHGQKVDFHDVGSGVPFVLPILYAAANQGFVKVQQPELHLHPALQSSLADVFVEELNRDGSGQFLIETHSEHLLLRLLRRIRDTEKKQCLSPEMKLTNRDIAVYYFDPRVDGGTMVTQQVVTPLGDFYTDWPRGFFAERNHDLFDE